MSEKRRRRGRRRTGKKRESWFGKLRTWQKVLFCIFIAFVCIVAAGIIYVFAKWDKIDTQEIKAEDLIINDGVKETMASLDLGDGYKNVALFGVDSRDGSLGEGNRTDCIIVASLNNETKEIKMISVYRDSLLDLSDGTYQKCNAAYSYGGPVMAINMLNMNLDLDIEDYVTVDFGAIADAIDLLGGVEIDLTDEEVQYLNQFLQETADSAGKEANFLTEGGLQLLDGTQATTYARIRSTEGGDFTRTERQRLVISKMFEKAKKADLATINSIIDQVLPQISTSFTLQELLTYATAYSEYTLGANSGFPTDYTMDTLPDIGSVVIPDDLVTNVQQMHEFLFGTEAYTPSSTVQSISANIQYTAGSSYQTEEFYDDTGTYSDGGYSDSGYESSGYYDSSQDPQYDGGYSQDYGYGDESGYDPGYSEEPGYTDDGQYVPENGYDTEYTENSW